MSRQSGNYPTAMRQKYEIDTSRLFRLRDQYQPLHRQVTWGIRLAGWAVHEEIKTYLDFSFSSDIMRLINSLGF